MVGSALWFLPLFAVMSLAQAPQPGDPTAKARIEGSVVSAAGGPVGRAVVRLEGPPRPQPNGQAQPRTYSITTDDAGRFTIENVEPSRNYRLTAQRLGFLQGRYGSRSPDGPGVPFALESGQSTTGVVITMIPQGAISGRIVDGNNDPIQGAVVTMLRRSYARGFRQLTQVGASNTNDLGEFRIANLSPGRYYMAVTNRRGLEQGAELGPRPASITTYFPNGVDAQSAAPIDMIPGQDMRGVEVSMRQGRVFAVRGKAVDTSGGGMGNTTLLLAPKIDVAASTVLNPMTRIQAQTYPDGSFEFLGMSPGLYTLQTSPPQAGASRGLGQMEVTVGEADTDGLTLLVSPGQTVTGTLTLEGGDVRELPLGGPGGNVSSNVVQVLGRLSVLLSDTSPLPLNPTVSGAINNDGTFTIQNVARGRFTLSVSPLPPGTYVKAARFSNVDIMHSEIDLTSGGGAGIEVVLARNPADVSGTILITDSNALSAAIPVSLWSAEPEPGTPDNGVQVGITDETGGFRFQNLRPGTYFVAAWEDVEGGLVRYRDFLRLLENEATKIEVVEGEHRATQVRIIPVERIRDAEGRLP